MPVRASESSVPRIVFENEVKRSTDLTIRKSFAGDVPEAEQDEVFTFTVQIGGQPADGREYKFYASEDAEPVTRTVTGGTIELQAGQRAVFEYLGTGTSYLVREELPQDSKFECASPSSGYVSDDMTSSGASVEFVNRYADNPEEGSKANLKIEKEIYLPEDLPVPEEENGVFRFRLNIPPTAPYTGSYRIYGGGEPAEGRLVDQMTDGSFTLKGGQWIVVPELPAESEYKVTELADEESGWSLAAGTAVRRGTAGSSGNQTFLNTRASLMVKKQMESLDTELEQDFTFVLSEAEDGTLTGIAGAEYYLYDISDAPGVFLRKEEVKAGESEYLRRTDGLGRFTLQAGQAAVFVNLSDGLSYNVSEQGVDGYELTSPGPDGYSGTIEAGLVKGHTFTNQPKTVSAGTLSVTKLLENTEAESPAAGQPFTFRLSAADDNTPAVGRISYTAVAGNKTRPGYTENGVFWLYANETAYFESLNPGSYRVEEMDLPSGFRLAGSGVISTAPAKKMRETAQTTSVETALTGSLTMDTGLAFTFKNEYTPGKLNLKIAKTSNSGAALDGAEFRLWMVNKGEETKDWAEAGKTEVALAGHTTADGGFLSIPSLIPGTYYLEETMAPAGYQLPTEPVKIVIAEQITAEGEGPDAAVKRSLTVTADGNDPQTIELSGNELPTVMITVKNDMLYALPSTGGTGTDSYRFPGISLMLAAYGMYLYAGRRRQGRR